MGYQPEMVIDAILGRNQQNYVNFVQIPIEFCLFSLKNLTWKTTSPKMKTSDIFGLTKNLLNFENLENSLKLTVDNFCEKLPNFVKEVGKSLF